MTDFRTPIQLSASVFLYQPDCNSKKTYIDQPEQDGPRLVILATWAFAHDKHIIKYVDNYQRLFPGVSILVLKSFLRHFFWLPGARKELEPAVSAIRSILNVACGQDADVSSLKPPLLVHLFSNSGLSTTYNLCDSYSGTTTGDKGSNMNVLPLHATIFDSSPGRYEYWSVASAVMFGVPQGSWIARTIAIPFAHLLSLSLWVWVRILGGADWVGVWAQAANNTSRSVESCRSYIYSTADQLVEKEAVEKHAAHAVEEGFCVLYQMDFGRSNHVAHSRLEPDRYWRIVRETWEGTRDKSRYKRVDA